VDVLGELAAEPGEVQAESLGVRQEIGGGELLLVLEQHLVHRPALALGARRLGGLGGRLGMRMHGGQGEVAEHEPEPVSRAGLDRVENSVRGAAVGALVFAILQQRDRGVHRAPDVIPGRRDRQGQHGFPFGHVHGFVLLLAISSSARRMPSAPGLTRTGDR
jgi:hypothetical protein